MEFAYQNKKIIFLPQNEEKLTILLHLTIVYNTNRLSTKFHCSVFFIEIVINTNSNFSSCVFACNAVLETDFTVYRMRAFGDHINLKTIISTSEKSSLIMFWGSVQDNNKLQNAEKHKAILYIGNTFGTRFDRINQA